MNDLKIHLSALTDALQAKQMTLATAESCTGGLIASFLTEKPGSSSWFDRGFVTYSNLSKHEMLGVDLNLIHAHGAVSRVVAEAMVGGVLQHSTADIALAVTGIAGPAGGSPEKPVGTVYFAFALRNQQPQSEYHCFNHKSRQDIRLLSCHQAFLGALSLLAA